MKIIEKLNKKVKKLDAWDIALIKWTVLLVGLVIGAYFKEYILPFWWMILVVAALLAIRPFYRYLLMLFKK